MRESKTRKLSTSDSSSRQYNVPNGPLVRLLIAFETLLPLKSTGSLLALVGLLCLVATFVSARCNLNLWTNKVSYDKMHWFE